MRHIRLGQLTGSAYRVCGRLYLFRVRSAGGSYDPALRHLGPWHAWRDNPLPFRFRFVTLRN